MEVESVMPLKLFSKPRRRKIGPEACLQITVVEYLRLAGVPGLLYFSVPNEQKCSVQRGAMLKRMGRLPGVSDLVIVIPRQGRKPNRGATPYKGVSWFAPRGYWRARIAKDGRSHILGYFDTPEAAHAAYVAAAHKYHGEFARTE